MCVVVTCILSKISGIKHTCLFKNSPWLCFEMETSTRVLALGFVGMKQMVLS